MGKADFLDEGNWNAMCFECGRKFKASDLIRNWKGYFVCKAHWEPREAQDFVRGVPDNPTPPWVQPMPADVFVLPGTLISGNPFPPNQTPDIYLPYCTVSGVSAVPGQAVPGCCIPGYLDPNYTPA